MVDLLISIDWSVDHTAFTVLGRDIRWYGIFWATGVLLTAFVVQKMFESEKLPEKWFDSFFIYILVGLIIGARLGHCLFYDPIFYLSHPLEMLKVWEGGLASHGGAIGMVTGVWVFSKRISKKSMIWALDRLVVGVAIGGAFIRIGNLMNSEIYGGPTSMPWGFNFLKDPSWYAMGELPCHPTQLYEALIYFVVFLVGMYLYWKTNAKDKQGLILGVSLIGIFGSRFLIEYIKNIQEPFEIEMMANYGVNMGQLLSLPFVIWGIWLIWNALRTKKQLINKKK